jgi:hypothetical protein
MIVPNTAKSTAITVTTPASTAITATPSISKAVIATASATFTIKNKPETSNSCITTDEPTATNDVKPVAPMAEIPKAKARRKANEQNTRKKNMHFTESLHSIRQYFPPNDVNFAVKRQSHDVIEQPACEMLPVIPSIVNATKANIDAYTNSMSGRLLSCGSYTLHKEDLVSLMPGKCLSDNVS